MVQRLAALAAFVEGSSWDLSIDAGNFTATCNSSSGEVWCPLVTSVGTAYTYAHNFKNYTLKINEPGMVVLWRLRQKD